MPDNKFYPAKKAGEIIEESGVVFDDVYNDRDGVTREQLTVLSQLSNDIGSVPTASGKSNTTLKNNVYKTIHRLHASANKKNIDFAANVKNTMYNTVQFAVMEEVEKIPEADQKKTMIKWLPSTADEQDPFHALNYGKTMTLDAALKKGLGTRYGCQCGMQIISDPNDVEEVINDI